MKLSERIAKELMTNGAGEEAQRLVLELPDGRDGGGWCKQSVIDTIETILQADFERVIKGFGDTL